MTKAARSLCKGLRGIRHGKTNDAAMTDSDSIFQEYHL